MDTSNKNPKSYWKEIVSAFPILSKTDESPEPCDDDKFAEIKKIIVENNLKSFVHGMVMNKIEQHFMSQTEEFWSYFVTKEAFDTATQLAQKDINQDFVGFEKFRTAVNLLFDLVQSYDNIISRLQMLFENNQINLLKNFNAQIRAILHSQLPNDYNTIIYQFYKISLKVFTQDDLIGGKKNISGDGVVEHCNGCGFKIILCKCDYIIENFRLTNRQMITMCILEPLASDVVIDLVRQKIETKVHEITKENFGKRHISALEKWIETYVNNWIKFVFEPKFIDNLPVNDNLGGVMSKLKHLLYELYTRTRIDQLFKIIIEYPDSEPAVIDLSFTLQMTNLKAELCKKLQSAIHMRLLHPAVNTNDIITAYTSAIKVLQIIDPRGTILHEITQPVRAYLRSRKDTVRCVMTTLFDQGTDITNELVSVDNDLEVGDVYASDQVDLSMITKWVPDPVDAVHADTSQSSKLLRNSDTVTMLVDIYGTRELFVNEYRGLLADRLLTQFMDNLNDEIRFQEVLKLRLGDSLLHSCSVMLKDVYDSKRINQHLYSANNLNNDFDFPVKALIVSNQFWPNFKDDFNVVLPPVIQKHLDKYTNAYESYKCNRTLEWKPNLGLVSIDLELQNKTLSFTVSPILATIIWHFQEQSEWTINDLSIKMHVPATTLRRRIGYWQNQGLLKEESYDKFVFVEDGIPTASTSGKGNQTNNVGGSSEFVYGDDDEEIESAVASTQHQREEELQVFWSYIMGMLRNLDSLPLDRIHRMLKMFATQGTGVDCSLTQLRAFLDEKVKQNLLVFTAGRYELPK